MSTQNPLWIPEIAQSILEYSKQHDGCRLARTCRPLFNSLMPLLWETVDGVEQLFKLIPGTQVNNLWQNWTEIAVSC